MLFNRKKKAYPNTLAARGFDVTLRIANPFVLIGSDQQPVSLTGATVVVTKAMGDYNVVSIEPMGKGEQFKITFDDGEIEVTKKDVLVDRVGKQDVLVFNHAVVYEVRRPVVVQVVCYVGYEPLFGGIYLYSVSPSGIPKDLRVRVEFLGMRKGEDLPTLDDKRRNSEVYLTRSPSGSEQLPKGFSPYSPAYVPTTTTTTTLVAPKCVEKQEVQQEVVKQHDQQEDEEELYYDDDGERIYDPRELAAIQRLQEELHVGKNATVAQELKPKKTSEEEVMHRNETLLVFKKDHFTWDLTDKVVEETNLTGRDFGIAAKPEYKKWKIDEYQEVKPIKFNFI